MSKRRSNRSANSSKDNGVEEEGSSEPEGKLLDRDRIKILEEKVDCLSSEVVELRALVEKRLVELPANSADLASRKIGQKVKSEVVVASDAKIWALGYQHSNADIRTSGSDRWKKACKYRSNEGGQKSKCKRECRTYCTICETVLKAVSVDRLMYFCTDHHTAHEEEHKCVDCNECSITIDKESGELKCGFCKLVDPCIDSVDACAKKGGGISKKAKKELLSESGAKRPVGRSVGR